MPTTHDTPELRDRHRAPIRVGITFRHGKTLEEYEHPPDGIEYVLLSPTGRSSLLRSPIKGALRTYDDRDVDLVETSIGLTCTRSPWICSLESLPPLAAFSLLGMPIPRSLRLRYIARLLANDRCRKIVFWSEAGLRTLEHYGRLTCRDIHRKATVVYPAIRRFPDRSAHTGTDELRVVFSGEFFRKGGPYVVQAFEQLRAEFPKCTLRLCCAPDRDFVTTDNRLRRLWLARVRSNPGITLGRVPREVMLHEILPRADVYVLPSNEEAFGFAILEAMAAGTPVIASDTFAIPEMITHGTNGFLVSVREAAEARVVRGYVVRRLPREILDPISERVYRYLRELALSPALRTTFAREGQAVARTKFSHAVRNNAMSRIYRDAVR